MLPRKRWPEPLQMLAELLSWLIFLPFSSTDPSSSLSTSFSPLPKAENQPLQPLSCCGAPFVPRSPGRATRSAGRLPEPTPPPGPFRRSASAPRSLHPASACPPHPRTAPRRQPQPALGSGRRSGGGGSAGPTRSGRRHKLPAAGPSLLPAAAESFSAAGGSGVSRGEKGSAAGHGAGEGWSWTAAVRRGAPAGRLPSFRGHGSTPGAGRASTREDERSSPPFLLHRSLPPGRGEMVTLSIVVLLENLGLIGKG